MSAWFESLTNYGQVLFVIAFAATLIMIVFIILMLIGFDNSEFDGIDDLSMDVDFDVDVDADFDIDSINDEPLSSIGGLKIFTIRGILAFLSMGSWTTMLFLDILSPWIATVIGMIVGLISAYLLALALRQAMKLESSGNIDYRKAIGKPAIVYLRVPKQNSGHGKVNLVLEDRFIEVDAITKGDEDILVNQEVTIVGLYDLTTVIVSKIKK